MDGATAVQHTSARARLKPVSSVSPSNSSIQIITKKKRQPHGTRQRDPGLGKKSQCELIDQPVPLNRIVLLVLVAPAAALRLGRELGDGSALLNGPGIGRWSG